MRRESETTWRRLPRRLSAAASECRGCVDQDKVTRFDRQDERHVYGHPAAHGEPTVPSSDSTHIGTAASEHVMECLGSMPGFM
jgi:hypothetical protein